MRNKKAKKLKRLAQRLGIVSFLSVQDRTASYPANSSRCIYKRLKKDCSRGGR